MSAGRDAKIEIAAARRDRTSREIAITQLYGQRYGCRKAVHAAPPAEPGASEARGGSLRQRQVGSLKSLIFMLDIY